jgi:hypothetical protein
LYFLTRAPAELIAIDRHVATRCPSPGTHVNDAVIAEVGAWQARPLEPMYPVIFFDTLRVKINEDSVVRNKTVYLALGCCPTARVRASTHNEVPHLDKRKRSVKVR